MSLKIQELPTLSLFVLMEFSSHRVYTYFLLPVRLEISRLFHELYNLLLSVWKCNHHCVYELVDIKPKKVIRTIINTLLSSSNAQWASPILANIVLQEKQSTDVQHPHENGLKNPKLKS